MPYLTVANSLTILRRLNIDGIAQHLGGVVYKKPIYFFSRRDENKFLAIQKYLEDPEAIIEFYNPINVSDTLTFVFEGTNPAYHCDLNCKRLHSEYRNFKIPEEIKARAEEQGEDEVRRVVIKFREWFKKHRHLIDEDLNKFILNLSRDWVVEVRPDEINRGNSGTEEKENYDLSVLESKIDEILSHAGKFYRDNFDKQHIIKRFARYAFLGYYKKPIENNNTGVPDEELKNFLRMYDSSFKKPVCELLIEYYRVKFNPNLKFEGYLLEKLNFKPCRVCYGAVSNEVVNLVATTAPIIGEEMLFPTEEPPYL